MNSILILGAGKSSVYLIEYLIEEARQYEWKIRVADYNIEAARTKTGNSPYAEAIFLDIHDIEARKELIADSTIVISLLPPTLHYFVALDCLELGKHLFTASYIDENIRQLRSEIEEKKLLFLCELGLDPGIDHMSAMQMIDSIREAGGIIHSFKSHCGGLVAPENDDNPWHYKISWNPRNVVLAGQAGAVFKESGEIIHLPYHQLFQPENTVEIPELGELCWYANRNSIPYMELYGLETCHTFLRTTLRYPEFCLGWKNLVDLKLTDETIRYDTDGMTLQTFFKLHFSQHGFAEWVDKNLTSKFRETAEILDKIEMLINLSEDPADDLKDDLKKFMLIDENGQLNTIGIDEIKLKAADRVAWQKHEASLIINQLVFLGMNDDLLINKGICSAADVLQFALEKKLTLNEGDKDMVVMLHEVDYSLGGKNFHANASLIVKGEDNIHTAMAKTVGLPLGIAASLFLQGRLPLSGLRIPVTSEVYTPVMNGLKIRGIIFHENNETVE
ncbi:MAG: saccharopine dehydrogenase [Chitinophagaceae bacterium]|nr:MAG: saccharopine dehydrogenase [Chitinophagaceae bacterium]